MKINKTNSFSFSVFFFFFFFLVGGGQGGEVGIKGVLCVVLCLSLSFGWPFGTFVYSMYTFVHSFVNAFNIFFFAYQKKKEDCVFSQKTYFSI